MWHASISLQDLRRRRPVAVADWDGRDWEKARAKLRMLLLGVGTGEDVRERGDVAIHLKRRLSDGELARLDPAWLACPAVDGAAPPEWEGRSW